MKRAVSSLSMLILAALVIGAACSRTNEPTRHSGEGKGADGDEQPWQTASPSQVIPRSDKMVFEFSQSAVQGQFVYQNGLNTFSGAHQRVEFPPTGRREIDQFNQPSALHPDLSANDDPDEHRMMYEPSLGLDMSPEHNVFPSSWWPQSKNGVAHRWHPNKPSEFEPREFNMNNPAPYKDKWERWKEANPDGANFDADVRKYLSPVEKYDLMFNGNNWQGATVRAVNAMAYSCVRDNKSWDECSKKREMPEITVAGEATRWELQNHGNYQRTIPEGWWGHCNGWASYATAEKLGAPKRDIIAKFENGQVVECDDESEAGCFTWFMGDIEALMSEVYFSDSATFTGRRCNADPSDMEKNEDGTYKDETCWDVNPATLHTACVQLLGEGKGARPLNATDGNTKERLAFIIDHSANWEVWNFPVVACDVTRENQITFDEAEDLLCSEVGDPEASEGENGFAAHQACLKTNRLLCKSSWDSETCEDFQDANKHRFKFYEVANTYTMISDDVNVQRMTLSSEERLNFIRPREVKMSYILEVNESGEIHGGEWIKAPAHDMGGSFGANNKDKHPDFIWMAYNPVGWGENADDTGGFNDNPHISYKHLRQLLSIAVNGGGGGGGGGLNICENHCDADQQTPHNCWCDGECAEPENQDCCQANGTIGPSPAYVCEQCSDQFLMCNG